MSKGVKSIGASAFAECSSLETVRFAKKLIDIGKEAFCDCTALKSITVPAGVKVMGESVFFGCDGLKEAGKWTEFKFRRQRRCSTIIMTGLIY